MVTTWMLAVAWPGGGPPPVSGRGPMILPAALIILILVLLLVESTLRRRQARRMGYRSWGEYLRSVPATDLEKRQAVDMAARGVVYCVLGILFPPLVIVGLFPLYRGIRKLGLLAAGVVPTPRAGSGGTEQPQH